MSEIADMRRARGWSQKRLAEALGVHQATISKWERGVEAVPRVASLALRALQADMAETRPPSADEAA